MIFPRLLPPQFCAGVVVRQNGAVVCALLCPVSYTHLVDEGEFVFLLGLSLIHIFKGCLYFGLMLTPDGPKVIEYNCRFGDPETQVVLPLLESDLLHIMQSCTDGTLAQQEVKFSDGAAACVILASGGYPVAYEKGKPISGLVDGQLPGEENVTVYHSGTAITEDGQLVTNGGRVLGVTAIGPRLTNALSHAYEAAEKISFEKLHKRSDIGLRALKALAEKQ